MAITRAQQARQMLKKGSKKPVKQAGVMNYMPSEMVTVPKIAKSSPDTPTAKLAYITPEEQDILIDLNLYGSLDGKPNRGPGGIPSLEGDFGSTTGSTYSGGSGDEKAGGGGGGNFSGGDDRRESYITDYSSKAKVKGGGKQKPFKPGGGPGDQDYDDFQYTSKNRTKAMEDKFKRDRGLMTLNLLRAGVPKANTPSVLANTLLNAFGPFRDFTLRKNIDYFKERPKAIERYGLTADGYAEYMRDRLAGKIDAAGNIAPGYMEGPGGEIISTGNDGGGDNQIFTLKDTQQAAAPTPIIDPTRFRFMNRGGMVDDDDPVGGIMDLESGRQMYFAGKLVKSIGKGLKSVTRAAKKVFKSPFGKAALFAAPFVMGGGGGALGKFFGKGSFSPFKALIGQGTADMGFGPSGLGRLLGDKFVDQATGKLTAGGIGGLFGLATLLSSLQKPEEDQNFDLENYYKTEGLRDFIASLGQRNRFLAEGGKAEPVAKKTMPLLDLDGQEMDFRAEGGFVPIGRMEKADDVPARLSKNEFVFTAEAVRNAGDGDVDKGAEVMYNTMKNLEAGGKVSEETQGLDGAKEMFQTAQRLEGVM